MTDANGMTDETRVELNADPMDADAQAGENVSLPRLPERPAESGSRAEWVDYAVALGADRNFLEEDTVHAAGTDDAGETKYATYPKLTVAEIKDLADSIGG